jgi:uncharacterized protein (DUF1501 family)
MSLTRRTFLKSTGAAATYLGLAPLAGAVPLAPVRVKAGKTLVVVFLRGGTDGLNLVVPHGDEHYYKLRRSIAVGRPGSGEGGAIDLDGHFGLHPRLRALKPLFDENLAVAAHAVGYAQNTRSHFEEQDTWETGVVGSTVNADGWLNRHLATSEGSGGIRAVSIGDALPRILHGDESAYAIRGLESLTMPRTNADPAALAAAFERAYCSTPSAQWLESRKLLGQAARVTLDGVEKLREVMDRDLSPKEPYPQTSLGRRLAQVARLIKADVGLEVAEVDLGGWDTHAQQGSVGGQFGNLAQQLGDAVAAFTRDLDGRMDDVVLLTLSDFGRTAGENGTGGTDHGWANCMMLVGGPVAKASTQANEARSSRKVVGTWPGLAPNQLHQERDLLHTTDFRDVIAEVVRVHLGNPNVGVLMPGHAAKPIGIVA